MTALAVSIWAAFFWLLGDVPQGTAPDSPGKAGEFTFVRAMYTSVGGDGEAYYYFEGRLWDRWETDFPEADGHFLTRMAELTTLQVNPRPLALSLSDVRLLKYPFLYMSDPGWQSLTEPEVKGLRTYLQRGGFLWVDDFWGDGEWENFELNMNRVFPDLEWREIPATHPIMNMVFPLEECPQIPAKIFWDMGWTHTYDEPNVHRRPTGGIAGVDHVNFMGLWDDHTGRLMAVATHNTDIGDGWERETEDAEYFRIFSTKSYALGINIVTYAMTH
jgi:Domain of unknown function (DUF4159)